MKLLTADEMAAILNITRDALAMMCYRKRIPYIKIGRVVRFNPLTIEKWLNKNTVDAVISPLKRRA